MAFYWTKNINGGPAEMRYAVCDGAVKEGDLLGKDATTAVKVEVADASDTVYVGVAMHDAIDGATVAYMPCEGNVFIADTGAGQYTDADDRFTFCDATFTTGSMGVNPGVNTSTSNEIFLLGLADGETDDTVGNKVLCMINKGLMVIGA